MPDSGFVFPPAFRVVDASIAAVPGGKLKFYQVGTTTPTTVYSDSTLSTSLGSTVYTDSAGHPVASSGSSTKVMVYTGATLIKLVVTDADDVTIATYDNMKCTEDTSSFGAASGSGIEGVTAKTADYSVVLADDGLWFDCDPTAAAFTMTLPSAATVGDGFAIGIRHAGTTTTNAVKVATVSSQTITGHGAATTADALTGGGEAVWLVSNGANWKVISHTPPRMPYMPFPIADRLTAPPTSPAAGAFYLINGTPTLAWITASYAQHDIVRANGAGGWILYRPYTDCGWLGFVQDEDKFVAYKGTAWEDQDGMGPAQETALATATYQDQKSNGTAGGSSVASAWTARVLNTEVHNTITGCSLATDTITLPAGSYLIMASSPFYNVNSAKIRFKSTTTATVINGTQVYDSSTFPSGAVASLYGRLTLSAEEAFKLEYYCESVRATDGLGLASPESAVEIYSTVQIVDLTSLQGATGAQGAQGPRGASGLTFNFDSSTTMADPGAGDIRLNHATLASVTAIAISDQSAASGNPDVSPFILSWDDESAAIRGTVTITNPLTPENFAVYNITGASTDNSGWTQLAVTYVIASGSFASNDDLDVTYSRVGATGGTGNFDTLAPTTTRGDLIYRNATTNTRLAASTSGYLLQTNGAGTDPTWSGFLQAGTGASTLTWQNKARQFVTAEDFGAVGDGVTNDATAMQAAMTYAGTVAGTVILLSKTYLIGTLLTLPTTASLEGIGSATLKATGVLTKLLQCGPTSGTTQETVRVRNVTLDGNSTCTTAVLSCRNLTLSVFQNIVVKSGSAIGFLTDTDTSLINTRNLRNTYVNIRCASNGTVGAKFIGEKDSQWDTIFAHDNTSHGVWFQAFNHAALQETTTCNVGKILARDNGGDGVIFDGCEKYRVGGIVSTINTGWGVRFLSTYIGGASFASNNLCIDSILCRNNTAGGITNYDGSSASANVVDLQVGSVKIIGDGSTVDARGLYLLGVTRCRFGSVQVILMGSDGIHLAQGTVNSVTQSSGAMVFDSVQLISNGVAGSSTSHGMVILNSCYDITVNKFYSDNSSTNGTDYELNVAATATNITIHNADITSQSGSNGINGAAYVKFTGVLKIEGNVSGVYYDASGNDCLSIYAGGTQRAKVTSAALSPATSDALALGTTSLMWSDAFFASGAVVNFNNGDMTVTHSADKLSVGGGTFASGYNAAASTPPVLIEGTWFTGGSATTTKPQVLIEPTGTTSTAWSTSGTGLGVNAASGFAGNLADFQIAGATKLKIQSTSTGGKLAGGASSTLTLDDAVGVSLVYSTSTFSVGGPLIFSVSSTPKVRVETTGQINIANAGVYAISSTSDAAATKDTFLSRAAAATWQLGVADAASPVAQTLQTQGSRSGSDTNVGGGDLTIKSGRGTGTGTISSLILQSPVAVASGTGAQTMTTGLTIKNGTAVRPSYTVATLPAAATAGAGAMAWVTDATATTFLSTVAGGGANKVPVSSDGTNWLIG